MNLEWLIPLRTLVITLNYGVAFVTGFALTYGHELGWGWRIAAILAWGITTLILIQLWEWLDELISEEKTELAWEGLDGYESA